MRDNKFLEKRLEKIWQRYFTDVKKANPIHIKFGRKASKRLGSIRRVSVKSPENFDTQILINGFFKDLRVPLFVIDATIAHELCHYAHGFSSPLPRLSRYPHRGGVIDKEMAKRKIDRLEQQEFRWLTNNWKTFIKGDEKGSD